MANNGEGEIVMVLPDTAWDKIGILNQNYEEKIKNLSVKPTTLVSQSYIKDYLKGNPLAKIIDPVAGANYMMALYATPPTTTSTPVITPATVSAQVKTAPIDTVLFNDDEVLPELMEKLIFENIGGHELINIARNDIINGQDISYQPIKNLSSLQQQYNPNNILSLQSTSDKYFANFAIKLENRIPNIGNGPFGSNVYLDVLNGNLVVDLINMESDEQVEIEITLSGTIYEADLTGSES